MYEDNRGWFKETWSDPKYAALGLDIRFPQDSCSRSARNVIRGLHYDLRMAKLVQCLRGSIFDVIVDLRRESPTYLQWESFELTDGNHKQLFVPAGFAHGFMALDDDVIVHYKNSVPYDASPALLRGLRVRDGRRLEPGAGAGNAGQLGGDEPARAALGEREALLSRQEQCADDAGERVVALTEHQLTESARLSRRAASTSGGAAEQLQVVLRGACGSRTSRSVLRVQRSTTASSFDSAMPVVLMTTAPAGRRTPAIFSMPRQHHRVDEQRCSRGTPGHEEQRAPPDAQHEPRRRALGVQHHLGTTRHLRLLQVVGRDLEPATS